MNRAINISLYMHLVCHVVDRMGDTRVLVKCATVDRLCPARALHIRDPFPVSAHVGRRLEKLRHFASVGLTCMGTCYVVNAF